MTISVLIERGRGRPIGSIPAPQTAVEGAATYADDRYCGSGRLCSAASSTRPVSQGLRRERRSCPPRSPSWRKGFNPQVRNASARFQQLTAKRRQIVADVNFSLIRWRKTCARAQETESNTKVQMRLGRRTPPARRTYLENKQMKLLKLSAALALMAAAGIASATVTFNPETGTGFAGKGDIQLAFGWNNAQLQARAAGVTFTFVAAEIYTAICTWTTGEGTRGERTHNVGHSATVGVAGTVAYDARVRNQITGFNLTGYSGAPLSSGSVPVVGAACPGNPGTDGVWTSVSLTSSTVALNAVYSGLAVKIWPPAL